MEVMYILLQLDYYIVCILSSTNLMQASIGGLGSHVLRTVESQDGSNMGLYIITWREATGQSGVAFLDFSLSKKECLTSLKYYSFWLDYYSNQNFLNEYCCLWQGLGELAKRPSEEILMCWVWQKVLSEDRREGLEEEQKLSSGYSDPSPGQLHPFGESWFFAVRSRILHTSMRTESLSSWRP